MNEVHIFLIYYAFGSGIASIIDPRKFLETIPIIIIPTNGGNINFLDIGLI